MKIVKKKFQSSVKPPKNNKKTIGRPRVFDEIKTYGFTLPPIYRHILALEAKAKNTTASALIREWIDKELRSKHKL